MNSDQARENNFNARPINPDDTLWQEIDIFLGNSEQGAGPINTEDSNSTVFWGLTKEQAEARTQEALIQTIDFSDLFISAIPGFLRENLADQQANLDMGAVVSSVVMQNLRALSNNKYFFGLNPDFVSYTPIQQALLFNKYKNYLWEDNSENENILIFTNMTERINEYVLINKHTPFPIYVTVGQDTQLRVIFTNQKTEYDIEIYSSTYSFKKRNKRKNSKNSAQISLGITDLSNNSGRGYNHRINS